MIRERLRVLVVDDVEDQSELLRTHLTRAGCDVVTAAGTQEAEEQITRQPPDVAVIDLLLAGDDNGWLTSARVRALAPRAAIVITSVLDVSDYPEADATLHKPFTGAQVKEIVARLKGTL